MSSDDFEQQAGTALVPHKDGPDRYQLALQVARQLNSGSQPKQTIRPANALADSGRHSPLHAALPVAAVVSVGTIFAGISALVRTYRRHKRATAAKEISHQRQLIVIGEAVIYRHTLQSNRRTFVRFTIVQQDRDDL